MQGMWLQHPLDERDGDGAQQAVSSYLVLHHASHNLHQTSASHKGSAASIADRAIPSRMAYDDEAEEHHGGNVIRSTNYRRKWNSMRRSFRYGFQKKRAVRRSNAAREASNRAKYL